MNQTDRSIRHIQDEISEIKSTVVDVKKATYALVRVTFILLIVILAGLIWG